MSRRLIAHERPFGLGAPKALNSSRAMRFAVVLAWELIGNPIDCGL
jgi:hypothetical protein